MLLSVRFGSPPRAWGQPRRRPDLGLAGRFTPTGVGTTAIRTRAAARRSVHPHGRGDNVASLSTDGGRTGSPPRAWGQPPAPPPGAPACRFTPTGVGTTPGSSSGRSRMPVHPHGRGDNLHPPPPAPGLIGSPPRAWGQQARLRAARLPTRFTPTGVGTTQTRGWGSGGRTVHPHGRGDNLIGTVVVFSRCGSPPRAWGQQHRGARAGATARFTPTGVGTTWCSAKPAPAKPVHPHGRGDNRQIASRSPEFGGSPPRAWGQLTLSHDLTDNLRFTPTGVGTTMERAKALRLIAVHPHGRGDNKVPRYRLRCPTGSPPRAWGQPVAIGVALGTKRFTPTGVGTTG